MTYAQNHNRSQLEYWYKSGKPAAQYVNSLGSERIKAWDENGNETENATDIIDRILAELEPGSTN